MSEPPYAILRVKKIKGKAHAKAATDHNYRHYPVANADEHAPHPSPEFLNHAESGYWDLAIERLTQAGITARRNDAIRCVEVMLTASPQWFKRDEQGQAADYSTSKWAQDNLAYLQKTFGKENVVAFKIHQDEKTPHLHGLIVPITPDGRLSARDMVGRPALKKCQSSYASAMAEHGLQRGVERSQAKHKPMRQFYGQQAQTAQQVEELTGPVAYKPVEVRKPDSVFSNLQQWATAQTKAVNDQLRPQVEEANKRAEKAFSLALENAAAKDQVRVLQLQLGTSEKHKQAKAKQVDQLSEEVTQLRHEVTLLKAQLEQAQRDRERFAIASYEGRPVAELATEGKDRWQYLREAELVYTLRPRVEQALERGQFTTPATYFQQLHGYAYEAGAAGQPDRLHQLAHPHMSFTLAEARPEGKTPLLQAIQADLADRQREQEQRAREQAAQARQALVTKELTLMERAFEAYKWKTSGDKLRVCLLVPDEQVKRVEQQLHTGGAYGKALQVYGEPFRRDGLTPVYTLYELANARAVTRLMAEMRGLGGEAFEPASDQARRERTLEQAPAPANRQPGQAKRSSDLGIGDDSITR
jgi:hypothetical protein